MDAFDKLVAKHFPQAGPLQVLMEMVEEQLGSFAPKETLREQGEGDTEGVVIHLPIIRITEDWGKVSKEGLPTEDRQIIEMYTKNIKGNTVAEKINYLNNIIAGAQEGAKLKEILGTMVVLEVLSAILEEFTESAGGFIFEAFLAGLFGGQSVQITDPKELMSAEGGEGSAAGAAVGKPITDVILNDRHYSLKLLGPTTVVKGSFRNMVEHFKSFPEIIYLDARRSKEGTGLTFGEFRITLLEFMDVFYTPLKKDVTVKIDEKGNTFKTISELRKSIKQLQKRGAVIKIIKFGQKYSFSGKKMSIFSFSRSAKALSEGQVSPDKMEELAQQILTDKELTDEFGPFQISYSEQVFEKSKAKDLFGSLRKIKKIQSAIDAKDTAGILQALEETPGYQKERQFVFSRSAVEQKIDTFEEIGVLQLGDEILKKTWLQYGELLNATIGPVYEALNSFSTNISSYFLEAADVGQKRRQAAVKAIGDAENLKNATVAATETLAKEQ